MGFSVCYVDDWARNEWGDEELVGGGHHVCRADSLVEATILADAARLLEAKRHGGGVLVILDDQGKRHGALLPVPARVREEEVPPGFEEMVRVAAAAMN